MRHFLNLFLSLLFPIITLFIALSIGYFMLDYDLNKALRLGTVLGFIFGIVFSAIISGVLLILRRARAIHDKKMPSDNMHMRPSKNKALNKKFILLMDKILAFDVIMQSIIDQHIGEVGKGNKKNGTITVYTPGHSINISVEKLTRHTSEIKIQSDSYSDDIEQIILYTKNKENSFLQY